MKPLEFFKEDAHRPFFWDNHPAAALLVHGFPGTPAEMRPLGQALHRAGWTVQGLLLPGFGPDIDTLAERNYQEWITAIEKALRSLQETHAPVLLIGYSFGASLSIRVAARQSPCVLVLLAPFRRLGTFCQQFAGLMLKPFVRQIRPFKDADFSAAETRKQIRHFLGDADLEDPEVRQALRELRVPTRIFEELARVGRLAYRHAPELAVPSLIIQGSNDEIVRPDQTRRLLQRFPGPVQYTEITAGHDLLETEQPAWPLVEQTILNYVALHT